MEPAANCHAFEPHLTIFYCDRCCGPSPSGPGDVHCRFVPCCAGSVDGRLIADAFSDGADGVMVLGCVGRACCTPMNELAALQLIHDGAMALHRLGLESARLQRAWLTPREASTVPGLIAAFRRRVVSLEPRRGLRTGAQATTTAQPAESAASPVHA